LSVLKGNAAGVVAYSINCDIGNCDIGNCDFGNCDFGN
jgi:hypothetical protein